MPSATWGQLVGQQTVAKSFAERWLQLSPAQLCDNPDWLTSAEIAGERLGYAATGTGFDAGA